MVQRGEKRPEDGVGAGKKKRKTHRGQKAIVFLEN